MSADNEQSAFQNAFTHELAVVMAKLPPVERILDVPCGRGFYTALLAPRGGVVAIDSDEENLAATRGAAPTVEVRNGDAYRLDFADGSFDLVWCAESFITLDAPRALPEFRRVLAPRGRLYVLEVDEFHHVLLPWPLELETALPAAQLKANRLKYGRGSKHSPARRLRRQLTEAGFTRIRRKLIPLERVAPFNDATRTFLGHYLERLRQNVRPHLAAAHQAIFDQQTNPEFASSLWQRPDVELTLMLALYEARV